MDRDIAVLIIHALIKQLGMHRAKIKAQRKTSESGREREAMRDRRLKEGKK